MRNLFEWIERTWQPKGCHSVAFMYDEMASQSGCSLPIIYQPFDIEQRSHWRDRGSLFDFLLATEGEGKSLLDLGPGDGWPSLIVAPFAGKVTGVDGSRRRVQVCTENARRMGIQNATFVHVEPGTPLPFDANTFDGAMAASSLEQTPDPRATLRELFRVLHPGGRLRIGYEDLDGYRYGQERAIYLDAIDNGTCRLTLYDRHVDEEQAKMYRMTFSLSRDELRHRLSGGEKALSFDRITIPFLEALSPQITEARICSLTHPSGKTLARWLKEIGFAEVMPSHSGSWFAGQLFDRLPEEVRPDTLDGLDAILRPSTGAVVQMKAPVEINPMITAVK